MASLKLTISDTKTGKSVKKDITDAEAEAFTGKDINETVSGDSVGFPGYEFQITGGSDYAGFPMRHGIVGAGRKRILTYKGVGYSGKDRWSKTQKGLRTKVTVAGQKVQSRTVQLNLKVTKQGPVNI